ncbi:LysR family transcriptional regulator [Leucobacter aridicollis]|uniref:LysR family transcriptional regulator n=1 Tax=Leucobacter aridicollis TaxID=283878 RepID=UPI00210652B6|nr:LysR family transcriptional regulator [Leucobacter aridicollis]UTX51816.1 LysR family transcriptional regulator [Leucobacter aridicollis]
MEQHHVVAFLALTEELHFGRAADRVFVTQPTLSRTIRSLEYELGTRLFDRLHRRVELTEAGSAFLEPARALYASYERALNSVVAAAQGLNGTVRLVFTGPSSYRRVADLASAVSSRFPNVKLELIGGGFAGEGLHRLLSHTADAALGRWTTLPESVSARPLSQERFVIAVPSTHPLAGESSVPFGAFATEPFIQLKERSPSVVTERFTELCAHYDISASIRQSAPDTWTALALVASGVGVALTLTSVRDNTNVSGVTFLDLDDDVAPTWLSLAWLKANDSPALASVLGAVDSLQEPGTQDRVQGSPPLRLRNRTGPCE